VLVSEHRRDLEQCNERARLLRGAGRMVVAEAPELGSGARRHRAPA